MSWNVTGQYIDVLLSCVLILRLFVLGLNAKYRAFLVFIAFDSFQSLINIAVYAVQSRFSLDYRILWCGLRLLAWMITIWMVYALLIAILKQLPGILRFSLLLLNVTFAISVTIAVITVHPQYTASGAPLSADWKERMTNLAFVTESALSLAELLAILAILTFVLFFPIRVPRNLASFSTGLSAYLFLQIVLQLLQTYVPQFEKYSRVADALPYFMAACVVYWIFSVNGAGEKSRVTLGGGWRTVPQDHLVHQLEAMNDALLRSRRR